MALEYTTLTLEEIIEYCKEHNEVAWLKETAATKVLRKKYTGKKEITKADGTTALVVDKNSPYIEVEEEISFIELKKLFAEKFMDMKPKKKKKSMFDLINEL